MSEQPFIEIQEEEKECKACGYVLAGIGLVIGGLFLYMSIDVLTNGGLTRAIGLGTSREVVEE